MTETETPIITEATDPEVKESKITEATDPEVKESKFKIETLDDLRNLLVVAKGGDPNAIQAITNFMDFGSNIERSYFPDKLITLCTAQLNGFGQTFFPNRPHNPFALVSDVIAVHFMAYKGYKSNQFVEMTRQSPNLDALQTSSEEIKQGVVSRILSRGKTE